MFATLGSEQFDYYYVCFVNFSPKQCDHADFSYYPTGNIDFDSTIGESPLEIGLIWRPASRIAGPSAYGSKAIDQTYPRLVANSTLDHPYMGMVLDKVGAVTGWTYGSTYKTCTSIAYFATVAAAFPREKIHCQDFVSYSTQSGDSGGPVFQHYTNIPPSVGGNGVTFVGIHIAEDWPYGGIFSSVRQIKNEIGSFYLNP